MPFQELNTIFNELEHEEIDESKYDSTDLKCYLHLIVKEIFLTNDEERLFNFPRLHEYFKDRDRSNIIVLVDNDVFLKKILAKIFHDSKKDENPCLSTTGTLNPYYNILNNLIKISRTDMTETVMTELICAGEHNKPYLMIHLLSSIARYNRDDLIPHYIKLAKTYEIIFTQSAYVTNMIQDESVTDKHITIMMDIGFKTDYDFKFFNHIEKLYSGANYKNQFKIEAFLKRLKRKEVNRLQGFMLRLWETLQDQYNLDENIEKIEEEEIDKKPVRKI